MHKSSGKLMKQSSLNSLSTGETGKLATEPVHVPLGGSACSPVIDGGLRQYPNRVVQNQHRGMLRKVLDARLQFLGYYPTLRHISEGSGMVSTPLCG